jgi:hypothetical protein
MCTALEYTRRLNHHDPTLKEIKLSHQTQFLIDLVILTKCLATCPNVIEYVWLSNSHLLNSQGIELAQFLAASSTIEILSLSNNYFKEEVYLAIAAALRVNSSLRVLQLAESLKKHNHSLIDIAFVDALRINPCRPKKSEWWLRTFTWNDMDFKRLRPLVEKCTPPSMLEFILHAHIN